MQKHKNIGIIAAAAICVVLVGSMIPKAVAYFTDKDEAENTFEFGNVDIVPFEPHFQDDPDDPIGPLVPEQEVPKDPKVANNGTESCVVYLKVEVPMKEMTLVNEDGSIADKEKTEVFWLKTSGTPYEEHKNVFNVVPTGNWIQLSAEEDASGEFMTYLFGYQKILPPSSTTIENERDKTEAATLDSVTDTLFDKIQIKNYLEGSETGSYDVAVKAYGIQARYLKDINGTYIIESFFDENGEPYTDADHVLPKNTLNQIWALYADSINS